MQIDIPQQVGGCCKPYRWRAPQDGIERVMDSGWRVFKKMDSAAPEEFLSQATIFPLLKFRIIFSSEGRHSR